MNQVLADADTIGGRTLGLRIGGGPPEQLKHTMANVTKVYVKVIKSATSSGLSCPALNMR